MNSLQTTQTNLPTEPAEIAQYILFTNEQVTALRQKLKLVKKLKLANDVQRETERELRELQKVNLDAKVLIGTLFNALPKEMNNNPTGRNQHNDPQDKVGQKPNAGPLTYQKPIENESSDECRQSVESGASSSPEKNKPDTATFDIMESEKPGAGTLGVVDPVEPKTPSRPLNRKELAESLGFSHTEVKRFQQLAKHPEAVEQAKALAGTKDPETGKVFEPTASNVISLIQAREIKEDKEYTRSIDALTGLSKLHGTLEKLLALPEDEDLIKAMVYECDKDDLIMACDSIRTGLQRLQKILSVFSREVVKT